MKKILIWDLPIRIFHWAFSFCVTAALVIALSADDDSPVFIYHIYFGLSAAFLLLIRLIIAAAGTRYTKLRGLLFSPAETVKYFLSSVKGKTKTYMGHNPGTASAAIVMFLMTIGLLITGLNMNSDFMEDLHPVFAYIMLSVIILHLLGMFLHTIKHKEIISLSMISGKRNGPDDAGIKSNRLITALVLSFIIVYWFVALSNNLNPANSTIKVPFTNTTISAGEDNEHGSSMEHEEEDDDD